MVTFAQENVPALMFTVSWPLGYEMRNSKVKLMRACAEDHIILNLVMYRSRAVVFSVRATTAQLYPGQDTFEFNKGHMTKNQPITVAILLRESLGI